MGLEAAADARGPGRRRVSAASGALGLVVGAFVDQLAHAGVRHVCVCPGSRSTPLALLLAQHPSLRVWMHLDERSAGFFGLGLARALGQPVALLATSGTAAANFFPAVVEANLARVGLVVLTADRPHELRDNGAPQTVDQLRLYGAHAKWFFDLPEPDASLQQVRLVRSLAARAVGEAMAEPRGPVHLNWPFREPLVPAPPQRAPEDRAPLVVRNPTLAPPPRLARTLGRELSRHARGVIVCGPQDDAELPASVALVAQRLGYPLLADSLSGVRCGQHDRSQVIDAYDAFLRDPTTAERLEPEVVIRIGAIPTSKPLAAYLQRFAHARQILVDPGGWREPLGLATDVLHVDPRALCDGLAAEVSASAAGDWLAAWREVNAVTRRAIEVHLDGLDEPFEGGVFAQLAELLPDGCVLYAGNSMPVRDLDTFFPSSARAVRCLSNRGANGIDGVVSSALGASAAGIGRVVLVIGDVSFYHDLNGLLAARRHALDLLVVLLNNDGGGIFSFLPQAEAEPATFEELFGTPHGLDFRPLVEGFGGRFVRIRGRREFAAAVCDGLARGGVHVLEVPTDRARNVEQHRQVWRVVADALSPARVC
jgi:2-succinyl-5-enolpyruvyl-6-hydroxy-3-cyclohexene-1-carboxylate synthase